MSLEFLLTTLVIVASPGTGVLYTLAAGLTRGARASILAAFAWLDFIARCGLSTPRVNTSRSSRRY